MECFWYSLFRMLRVSKGNVDDFCNDLACTHQCLNADWPPLKRNRPIGYYELQVSWSLKRVTEPPEYIYKGLYQWHRVSHAVNKPKRKTISSDLKKLIINVSNFLKEKKREMEFKYMLRKVEGADSGCTWCESQYSLPRP